MSNKEKGSPLVGVLSIAVIIFICYLIFSPSKESELQSSQPLTAASETPEQYAARATLGQQLASLEFHEDLSAISPYSVKLDSLITVVANKYDEPRDTISDWTWRMIQLSREVNKPVKADLLMENSLKMASNEMQLKYRDVTALYGMALSK